MNKESKYAFIKYRGCIIDNSGDVVKVFGKPANSIGHAKRMIDESFIHLKNSIK